MLPFDIPSLKRKQGENTLRKNHFLHMNLLVENWGFVKSALFSPHLIMAGGHVIMDKKHYRV